MTTQLQEDNDVQEDNINQQEDNDVQDNINQIKNFENHQPFETFEVSTKTYIVYTNMILKIEDIFYKKIIPITPYVVVKKRRGRKKKIVQEDPNKDISEGSIIRLQYMQEYQGVLLRENTGQGYFRNSITIDIIADNKRLNFKVSRNGKFQITGCKSDTHAEKAILQFFSYIYPHRDVYELKDVNYLKVYFDPVMYNIDFSLGFLVNRENLDIYINTKTDFTSLLETTFGYTGVNIKIPVSTEYSKLKIKCKEYINDDVQVSYIPYDVFLENHMPPTKERTIKYNTFLVFQSGKVIMSGKDIVFMENTYYEFLDVIKKCTPLIKEVLACKDTDGRPSGKRFK